MPRFSKPKPEWWSWQTILEHAHHLGIPNFQRGAIWDAGNKVALLESMYEQSPCGSFVFWQPEGDRKDPKRHGVPLVAFRDVESPLWLVDGQQRTRALLETYRQLLEPHARSQQLRLVRESDLEALRKVGNNFAGAGQRENENPDSEDDAEEAESEMFLWLVVLPAMAVFDGKARPFFGKHSESRSVLRGSMFRRFHPRARSRWDGKGQLKPVPPIPLGTVPLAALIAPGGVFSSTDLRNNARSALELFKSERRGLDVLDDLLPWGPQFITGHAFERQESPAAQARPMTWSDVDKRLKEEAVAKQIDRLKVLLGDSKSPIFRKFPEMLTGKRIAVDWLPRCSVSTAIDAYVRINRAGIRVRSEEQALALLTRARPTLLDDLAKYIGRRDNVAVGDQRDLLTHESDRQMGFSVWMATATRYCALFLLGDAARKWLGTKAINKSTFGQRIDRVGPDETRTGRATWADTFASPNDLILKASSRTTEVLLLIDDILSTELFLDHRMARMQFASLQPLIDLFSRIPTPKVQQLAKDQGFRDVLAKVMLWTLLFPNIDKADMESLVIAIHDINEEAAQKEASPVPSWGSTGNAGGEEVHVNIRAALRRYIHDVKSNWIEKLKKSNSVVDESSKSCTGFDQVKTVLNRLALRSFDEKTKKADSLQRRAVGWLYAIERRNGASEFSWSAQFSGYARNSSTGIPATSGEPPEVLPLGRIGSDAMDENAYPEKQHVVPFVHAARIVNKRGTRATASEANAIGNLTWLSHRQNCLSGLADRWMVVDRDIDKDNLAARGFFAPATFDGEARMVVDAYDALVKQFSEEGNPDIKRAEHLYEALREGRRKWMVEQMRSWLCTDLSPESQRWLDG